MESAPLSNSIAKSVVTAKKKKVDLQFNISNVQFTMH
jgi:hypothetical protein